MGVLPGRIAVCASATVANSGPSRNCRGGKLLLSRDDRNRSPLPLQTQQHLDLATRLIQREDRRESARLTGSAELRPAEGGLPQQVFRIVQIRMVQQVE